METKDVSTKGEAVIVWRTVTGLGPAEEVCTKVVKELNVERTDVEVDGNGEDCGEKVDGPRGNGRKEDERPKDEKGPKEDGKGPRVVEVRKVDEVATRIGGGDEVGGIPVEDRLLTTMLEPGTLLGSVLELLLDCALLVPPAVPDGPLLRAM